MLRKVGMYGGTFNPLHLGHVNALIEASTMCNKLYVVLCYSTKANEINHKERFKWLKQVTSDMENVEVIEIEDNNIDKENYDWSKGAIEIKKKIGKLIDIVFAGDDYKGKNIFEILYPESEIYYFDRKIINISSTKIRRNPYNNFQYLPKPVQKYYLKKVVIIGTESCGKSTLIRNLAKDYNTTYVKEVGRDVCNEVGGIDNLQQKDFVDILIRQKALELEKSKDANKVLFVDTEAIITLYYLNLLYSNDKLKEIENLGYSISDLSDYDLYMFLEPDVKWVQDGTRTYGEDKTRKNNNNILKKMLKEKNIKYKIVKGDYHERLIKSLELVDKLIKK